MLPISNISRVYQKPVCKVIYKGNSSKVANEVAHKIQAPSGKASKPKLATRIFDKVSNIILKMVGFPE